MIVFDELDEATPDAKTRAKERLSHSSYKRVIELSESHRSPTSASTRRSRRATSGTGTSSARRVTNGPPRPWRSHGP